MNESVWERTRQNDRKRLLILLLAIILLCAAGVVLFLNNRDLIGIASDRYEPVSSVALQGDDSGEVPVAAGGDSPQLMHTKPDSTPLPPEDAASPEKKSTSVGTASLPDSSSLGTKKLSASAHSSDVSTSSAGDACCSVVLPAIACISENRKDVVINLSLELFFNDREQRSAILLRREDIKVMVLRTMRDQQLPAVKIHELESLLQKNIVSLFGGSVITRVKIRNIQIEKSAR